jgi:hypothetical protein
MVHEATSFGPGLEYDARAMLDWMALDRALGRAVAAWRRAAAELRDDPAAAAPFDDDILHPERIAEVAEADGPLAGAFSAWLRELVHERAGWQDRAALARAWQEPRPMPERDRERPSSPAAARRDLLTVSLGAPLRAGAARALCAHAADVSALALAAAEGRIERGRALDPAGAERGLAAAAAEVVLARTEALAADLLPRGLDELVHVAMAAAAAEGWPPRVLPRWVADVVRPSGLLDGLRFDLALRIPALGPMSFARALGTLGVAVLAAGRPPTMPLPLHQLPDGTRRHERFALYAGVAVEPAFARRVLGHGRERAREHGRAMAVGALAWLRLSALAVVLQHALGGGRAAAREGFAEVGARVFGEPPPASLLGVLPGLSAHAGARLCGALLSLPRRAELVSRHDEDWFVNPRAAEELRHEDTRALPDSDALELGRLEAAVDELVRATEERAG